MYQKNTTFLRTQTTPAWKSISFLLEISCTSCYDKHERWDLWHAQYAAHRTDLHLLAEIDGVRTQASVSLMRPSAGILCLAIRCDWRSGSLKKLVEVALAGSKIRLASWLSCVIYFADQLLTPYFSGARTLNGTPGGDGWAQVLGGQICWLSEPLHRFDADCSGSTSLKMQTHGKHEKLPPHRNTPRNPHPHSDRAHHETAREETRPMR